ncbi:MAG: 3-oxoacyl-[acyl-carrier-protein] reductase [Chlorobi bacterium]|nr:3-oxoacyl-[acyl-carrier-protein] reductase [Chlorobiota bacterium]
MKNLTGKFAIVTGASRGIGRAIAEDFIRRGVNVALFSRSVPDRFDELSDLARRADVVCLHRSVNVADAENVRNAVEDVHGEFERIDILVNNAGITRDTLLLRMKDEDWDQVINTNLKGTFLMTRAVSGYMIRQRSGKIVNISSVVGLTGNAGQVNYAASKAGIIGFTKATAKELASRNIQVNAVAPGFVETEMTAGLSEAQKEQILGIVPLKRVADPAEIAGVVAFLASSLADYITGQVVCVDGGMVM